MKSEVRGSAGEYQADERAGVARLRWQVSGRRAGRCRAAPLASIRQMTGQVSRGLAGLGQEDPLEKKLTTHSSILAWKIPWAEEPGGLQSTGSQRVGHS